MNDIHKYAIGAVGMTLILAAVFLVLVGVPRPPRDNPVVVLKVTPRNEPDLCPGERYQFDVEFESNRPSVHDVFGSIVELETQVTVPGTSVNLGVRNHSKPMRVVDRITFTVPELEPGNYERVTSISPRNVDAEPAFVVVPLTIPEECF